VAKKRFFLLLLLVRVRVRVRSTDGKLIDARRPLLAGRLFNKGGPPGRESAEIPVSGPPSVRLGPLGRAAKV